MEQTAKAVAAFLAAELGVRTVAGRSKVAEYPLLAVTAEEQGTVLLDGGRQVERTVRLTVTARADRTGEGNAALLAQAAGAVLRGIPLRQGREDRVLHPLHCETDGGELRFTVTFCCPVERNGGADPVPAMTELHLAL